MKTVLPNCAGKKALTSNLYYCWWKEFLGGGKKGLAGDAVREATSDAIKDLRQEAVGLKAVVAELLMENRLLKKAYWGWGGWYMRYTASEKREIIKRLWALS